MKHAQLYESLKAAQEILTSAEGKCAAYAGMPAYKFVRDAVRHIEKEMGEIELAVLHQKDDPCEKCAGTGWVEYGAVENENLQAERCTDCEN